MAEKKKLTDKEKDGIAMRNAAINYLMAKDKKAVRKKRTKATKAKRQLTGLAKFPGFQGFVNKNPMDK